MGFTELFSFFLGAALCTLTMVVSFKMGRLWERLGPTKKTAVGRSESVALPALTPVHTLQPMPKPEMNETTARLHGMIEDILRKRLKCGKDCSYCGTHTSAGANINPCVRVANHTQGLCVCEGCSNLARLCTKPCTYCGEQCVYVDNHPTYQSFYDLTEHPKHLCAAHDEARHY